MVPELQRSTTTCLTGNREEPTGSTPHHLGAMLQDDDTLGKWEEGGGERQGEKKKREGERGEERRTEALIRLCTLCVSQIDQGVFEREKGEVE